MWEQHDLDLWNKSASSHYIVHLTSPAQPHRSTPLLKLFFPWQWCHPPRETQLTLLSWKGTRHANSSPPYSFCIPWRWTRQLHGDTIARQTVDSGWTLCTVGLGKKNWAVASLFFFSIETSDCRGRNGCCQASLMSQLINELAQQRLN